MEVSKEQERFDWLGSNCWFCGLRPPVHGMSRVVNMRKVVDGNDGGMNWLYSSVAVPCCAECRAGHARVTRTRFADPVATLRLAQSENFLDVWKLNLGSKTRLKPALVKSEGRCYNLGEAEKP